MEYAASAFTMFVVVWVSVHTVDLVLAEIG